MTSDTETGNPLEGLIATMRKAAGNVGFTDSKRLDKILKPLEDMTDDKPEGV